MFHFMGDHTKNVSFYVNNINLMKQVDMIRFIVYAKTGWYNFTVEAGNYVCVMSVC